jgi:hypothetical protein
MSDEKAVHHLTFAQMSSTCSAVSMIVCGSALCHYELADTDSFSRIILVPWSCPLVRVDSAKLQKSSGLCCRLVSGEKKKKKPFYNHTMLSLAWNMLHGSTPAQQPPSLLSQTDQRLLLSLQAPSLCYLIVITNRFVLRYKRSWPMFVFCNRLVF